jgi:hypothetical protein
VIVELVDEAPVGGTAVLDMLHADTSSASSPMTINRLALIVEV